MKSSKIKTIAGRILFFLAVCFIFIMPILSLLRMSLTTDAVVSMVVGLQVFRKTQDHFVLHI